jgi:hypothetical protein
MCECKIADRIAARKRFMGMNETLSSPIKECSWIHFSDVEGNTKIIKISNTSNLIIIVSKKHTHTHTHTHIMERGKDKHYTVIS